MVRALTALLGFAAAVVLLAVAPNAGAVSGDSFWYVVLVWALAGLVAGALYQAGGIRRPGLKLNPFMLLIVFLPWAIVTVGTALQVGEPNSAFARWTRSVTPDTTLAHWVVAVSTLAFGAGLLLALSIVEPRVGVAPAPARAREPLEARRLRPLRRPPAEPAPEPVSEHQAEPALAPITRVS
jgi:hypothetical protein